MMIISVRSSGKYAGSVMAVEVVKERTIETRQDVSFIRQPPPDKEAALDTFNLFLIIIVVIIMIAVTVSIVSLLSRINRDWLLLGSRTSCHEN